MFDLFDFRRIRIEPVVEIRGAINDEEIAGFTFWSWPTSM